MVCLSAGASLGDVLQFERTRLDVGLVQDNQPVLQTFNFVNTGKAPVVLTMNYCHFCTPPILSKSVLQPGETGIVVLEIDTTGRKGRVTASATIGVEGTKEATTIEVIADVQPRVWVEPLQLFPKLTRGTASQQAIAVYGRNKGFDIAKVELENLQVTTETTDGGIVDEGTDKLYKKNLIVKFPADLARGKIQGQMHITTNDAEARTIVVTVNGEVLGGVTAQPQMVSLETKVESVWGAMFDVVGSSELEIVSVDVVGTRDECASVALDVFATGDAAKRTVVVSGVAPSRTRQWAEVKVEVAARVKGSEEIETIVVPVGMVVRQQ